MHVTLAVLLPVFVVLTVWQLGRATHGNELSWAYTFEWPLFGGYAIYMWWQLIHDGTVPLAGRRPSAQSDPDSPQEVPGWAVHDRRSARRRAPEPAVAGPTGAEGTEQALPGDVFEHLEEEDPELAAYNRYLAELAQTDRRHR